MTITGENQNVVEALRVEDEIDVSDFGHEAWARARVVRIERYWSGERAPESRHAEARVAWGDGALSVLFACRQGEPLVVSDAPRLSEKSLGLWDRDVCEIFVAPDSRAPERYFEFEAAPTGEWLDLAIRWRPEGRETEWEYHSGMRAAARVEAHGVTIAMRVPWRAFGRDRAPRAGERWRANLYRAVGRDPERGYLAWRPTHTPEPSFHVPAKFGWLEFTA
ncbi:MAG TPA: carbohydrate-binding family 9-like protein [Pyrinomonadaceae bacterium]|nr:carbohydrate-binding family 9-like protein [Pyrinomonadaceae bacterium]